MKRLISLISVLLVVILLFASCAGGEKKDDGQPAAGNFILGVSMPLSGANADAGQQNLNSVQLAVEQINAAGGLNGQQIELVIYDDESDPSVSLSNITKLCTDDKANAIAGSQMSSCMVGVLDTLTQYQVPAFTGGTSPSLTNKGCEYIFRATVNQDYVMVDVINELVVLGTKKVALMTGEDEAQIASGDAFKAACEAKGIEIVGWEYVSDTDTDYTAQCSRLIAAKPEAIFFAAAATPQPLIVKQLRNNGFQGMLWHKESLQQNAIDICGETANYVAFSWPTVSYTDVNDASGLMKEFLEAYKAKYGTLPTADTAYRGYDAMIILKKACEIAGSNDSAAIAAAIHTISDLQGLGGKMDFTGGIGEGYQSGQLYYIYESKYLSFTEWYASGGYDEYIASIA